MPVSASTMLAQHGGADLVHQIGEGGLIPGGHGRGKRLGVRRENRRTAQGRAGQQCAGERRWEGRFMQSFRSDAGMMRRAAW